VTPTEREDHDRFLLQGNPSWFYPLGAKVRVTLRTAAGAVRSVLVTVTDRGPDRQLVRRGRIIDLARAAFERLANPESGLASVTVHRLQLAR
jgi:rare lipoprotein A (peptidoglycan hydrolase)